MGWHTIGKHLLLQQHSWHIVCCEVWWRDGVEGSISVESRKEKEGIGRVRFLGNDMRIVCWMRLHAQEYAESSEEHGKELD